MTFNERVLRQFIANELEWHQQHEKKFPDAAKRSQFCEDVLAATKEEPPTGHKPKPSYAYALTNGKCAVCGGVYRKIEGERDGICEGCTQNVAQVAVPPRGWIEVIQLAGEVCSICGQPSSTLFSKGAVHACSHCVQVEEWKAQFNKPAEPAKTPERPKDVRKGKKAELMVVMSCEQCGCDVSRPAFIALSNQIMAKKVLCDSCCE